MAGEPRRPSKSEPPKPDRSFIRRFALLSQFLSELMAIAMIGFAVDYYFQTTPWGALGFAVLGITTSLIQLVRKL
jgi:F0F1-type ATP synthase assembly protein I